MSTVNLTEVALQIRMETELGYQTSVQEFQLSVRRQVLQQMVLVPEPVSTLLPSGILPRQRMPKLR